MLSVRLWMPEDDRKFNEQRNISVPIYPSDISRPTYGARPDKSSGLAILLFCRRRKPEARSAGIRNREIQWITRKSICALDVILQTQVQLKNTSQYTNGMDKQVFNLFELQRIIILF